MVRLSVALTALLTTAIFADDALPPLACEGDTPDWQLAIYGDTAAFSFNGEDIAMTIPQRTQVENAPFPKALTLISRGDTAIVILNERQCDSDFVTGFPIEANILTQQGETPVILRGCCTVAE